MTHSVTKTFLSAVAGIAFDRHMIRDVNDRVIDYVRPTPDFMLAHNQPITWDQMLRQTSGWIGTMWASPGGRIVRARIRGTNSLPVRRRSARNGNIPTCG
jgi:CubicO group peptidase (beta-lactamase class C family)